jgi:hypothetical protein
MFGIAKEHQYDDLEKSRDSFDEFVSQGILSFM